MIRRVVIIAGVLGIAVVFGPRALNGAGAWLVVEDELKPARSVAVLGGQVPFRAMEAARIYHSKLAPEVWLTRGHASDEDVAISKLGIERPAEYTYSERVLQRLGVPAKDIRVLPEEVVNTAEEVKVLAQALRAAHGQRMILVTSKYHSRRVGVLWRSLAGDRTAAIVRYAENDPFESTRWWHNTDDAMHVSREWFGLLNAWLGFPIASAH